MLLKGEHLWPLILYQSSNLKSFRAEGFLLPFADGESEVLRMGLAYLRLMGTKGRNPKACCSFPDPGLKWHLPVPWVENRSQFKSCSLCVIPIIGWFYIHKSHFQLNRGRSLWHFRIMASEQCGLEGGFQAHLSLRLLKTPSSLPWNTSTGGTFTGRK